MSAVISAPAFADRGRGAHFRGSPQVRPHSFNRHGHFGLFIGAPLVWAPGYVTSPYYYPPAVVVPSSPPVYIEKGQAAAPSDSQYWYYCRESETYYPYVSECAGPWQRVVPHAPPS